MNRITKFNETIRLKKRETIVIKLTFNIDNHVISVYNRST